MTNEGFHVSERTRACSTETGENWSRRLHFSADIIDNSRDKSLVSRYSGSLVLWLKIGFISMPKAVSFLENISNNIFLFLRILKKYPL